MRLARSPSTCSGCYRSTPRQGVQDIHPRKRRVEIVPGTDRLATLRNDIKPDLIVDFEDLTISPTVSPPTSPLPMPDGGWPRPTAVSATGYGAGHSAHCRASASSMTSPNCSADLRPNRRTRPDACRILQLPATWRHVSSSGRSPAHRQRTDFDPRNRKVVEQYLRNSKLMDLFAQNGGASLLHVLQPMLYLKEPLSEEERNSWPSTRR